MRRPLAAAATAVSILVGAPPSHAISPNFDGERGLEVSASLAAGAFTPSNLRLFQPADNADNPNSPRPMLGSGVNVRFSVGYRPIALFSAGAVVQVQTLGSEPIGGIPTTASASSIGVYGRFYPASLFVAGYLTPRVAFSGYTDLRRIDPWVGLGVEFYQSLTLRAQTPGSPEYSSWNRQSFGIPISMGLEVRPAPPFAIGLTFGLTPWIGGTFTQETRTQIGGNLVTLTNPCHSDPRDVSACTSPESSTLLYFFGISLRYTLTL